MHHCVEIVLPPQAGTTPEEIEKAVRQVLAQYDENAEDTEYPKRPDPDEAGPTAVLMGCAQCLATPDEIEDQHRQETTTP